VARNYSGDIELCPDPYEPDDSAGDARLIATDGTVQFHNFHQAAEVDWLAFAVVDEAVDYIIEAVDLAPATDTVLYLYDSDGQQLLDWNDDRQPGEPASYLYFNPYRPATFYLKVVPYDPSVGGCQMSYGIRVIAVH
jgi:hypothetical protein